MVLPVPKAVVRELVQRFYVDWIGDVEAARALCGEHGLVVRLCENVYGGVDLVIGDSCLWEDELTGREARATLLPDGDPVHLIDDLIGELVSDDKILP